MITAIKSAIVIGLCAILTSGCATAGWGKNKEVTCFYDDNGRAVVLTREVCGMHYENERQEQASLDFRVMTSNLSMVEPDNCATKSGAEYGACLLGREMYNQSVARLKEDIENPHETAFKEKRLDAQVEQQKFDNKMRIVETVLGFYTLKKGYVPGGRGSGQVGDNYFAGDYFEVNGKAGGPGGGENAGSAQGVSITKSGDNKAVINRANGRMQTILDSPGSATTDDNRREGTEFYPAAAEGSNATLSQPRDNRDQSTIGFGL